MRTFLRLAEAESVTILSYAASARSQPAREPDGLPRITVHAYVVVGEPGTHARLRALAAQSARLSPIARLLGTRLSMSTAVRLLGDAVPAQRDS
jgi:hypothetical protein